MSLSWGVRSVIAGRLSVEFVRQTYDKVPELLSAIVALIASAGFQKIYGFQVVVKAACSA